jgi:general secretion pathway protein I|tara:strand:- start:9925 stop:10275 length:351 start_codon:yes stop_codon:yes gene_type:complete
VKGFTLIEVLIALLILSIVSAAGLSSISYSTKNYQILRDNFYSATLAENILLKSYYDNSFLTNDLTSGNNIIMGRPFSWKRQININKSQNSLNLKVQIFSEINSKVADLELYKTIQ